MVKVTGKLRNNNTIENEIEDSNAVALNAKNFRSQDYLDKMEVLNKFKWMY